jgi:V/A-type H+-transporting ATPase subunit E
MSLDSILEHISKEVEGERDEILRDAREKSEAMLDKARETAENEAKVLEQRGQDDAKARHERIVTLARLEGRKRLLAAKQKVMENAFSEALRSLAGLPKSQYLELLKGMLVASAGGTEEVILSRRDRDALGEELVREGNRALELVNRPGRLRLSPETREISGGLILAGDRVEINMSFDSALGSVREELEPEVAGVLFGEG